jgi:hypothetical protein
MSNGNVDVTVTKEGLVIPMNLLKDSHIGDNVGIVKKEDLIIIKEKSFTDKVRGIVKDSKLSDKELDEIWFEGKK